jgi:hypothetical protein
MLHFILIILSIPFWFIGGVGIFAYFFGSVQIGKAEVYGVDRFIILIICVLLALIAWGLTQI